MKWVWVLSAVLLAGCSSASRVMDARTGQAMYTVDCSAAQPLSSWAACYARAEKLCPSGYTTLTTTYDGAPKPVSYGSSRKITITCND